MTLFEQEDTNRDWLSVGDETLVEVISALVHGSGHPSLHTLTPIDGLPDTH